MMITTVIFFQRHEEHSLERLLPEAEQRAIARGQALAERGVKIDEVYTSPRPRAVRTASATLIGNDSTASFTVEPRLSDMKTDPRVDQSALERWKDTAKERYGSDDEEEKALAIPDMTELHDLFEQRSGEGAAAILEMAAKHPGQKILATSHGIARMELTLRYLRGLRAPELFEITNELIAHGEIVKITCGVKNGQAQFIRAEPLQLLEE